MKRAGWQMFLGVALLLHGLGNAVLPLRGVDVVAPGVWMALFTVSYTIAIVGFVVSGLGVLGVRPLVALAIPASLAAGIAALACFVRLGDADIWPGLVLSFLLPIAVVAWPPATMGRRKASGGRVLRALLDTAGVAVLAWVTASALVWPWHRAWGTERHEWTVALPGDRAPRAPAMEILHAVTIDAPPSAVWPWLVQLGQDRGGFYSYERLERLFGVDVHNVREIRAEWQGRQPGDTIYATQSKYLGGLLGERPGWTVDVAEPNRALVLRYWGAFVLQPTPDGGTRFLIRSTISHRRIPAWAAALNFTAFEMPHFIMQRRMMLGIKDLAERHAPRRSAR
jgi:hypothetical protein